MCIGVVRLEFKQLLEGLTCLSHLAELHVLHTQLAQGEGKVWINGNRFAKKFSRAFRVAFLGSVGALLIEVQDVLRNPGEGGIRGAQLKLELDSKVNNTTARTGLAVNICRLTRNLIFLSGIDYNCIVARLQTVESECSVGINHSRKSAKIRSAFQADLNSFAGDTITCREKHSALDCVNPIATREAA